MFDRLKNLIADRRRQQKKRRRQKREKQLEKVREHLRIPVIWLFGKTETGKTSIVRLLTGADDAQIGSGFKPCTRFSREYVFPIEAAPLVHFLDTRGLGEPDYDPTEDLARFNEKAHVIVVTCKALDHAQETVLLGLRKLRDAKPSRPVLLALTCLHEAYPQQPHPPTYPFDEAGCAASPALPEALRRTLAEQRLRFDGLVDAVVPIDFTRAIDGLQPLDFGGEQFKRALLGLLPAAYQQTLREIEVLSTLADEHDREAFPWIVGYSSLAAAAGAVPVVGLFLAVMVQAAMFAKLCQLYDQKITFKKFRAMCGALGLGGGMAMAGRWAVSLIPVYGWAIAGVLSGAWTFALGKTLCYYNRKVLEDHVPGEDELKRYFRRELAKAKKIWLDLKTGSEKPPANGAGPDSRDGEAR